MASEALRVPRRARAATWSISITALALGGCTELPPRCASNAECALPALCIVDTCALPEPAEDDAPCAANEHCRSQLCLRVPPAPVPASGGDAGPAEGDGSVGGDAGPAAGDGAIGASDAVAGGDVTPPDAGTEVAGRGRCVRACTSAQECAPAKACLPVASASLAGDAQKLRMLCGSAPGSHHLGEACDRDSLCRAGICEQGQCVRACRAGECPAQTACEEVSLQRGGLELKHAVCRLEPQLHRIELGTLDTPAEGTNRLEFDLPAGVDGFVLYAIDDDGLRVGVRRLTGPDGQVLVDLAADAGAVQRAGPYIGSATVVVPGSEAVSQPLVPGRYSLELGTYDPQIFDQLIGMDGNLERVGLVYRRAGMQGGLIDINLHFSPGSGLKAETAASDPYVQQTIDRLRGLYRQGAGVSIGSVRFFNLGKDQDTVPDGPAARAICKAFAVAGAGQAVNLMIVQDLAFAAGFAGGVGSPPGIYGLPGSCVVLAKQATANNMGVVAAHELGHFLGLWHTTEIDGGTDPLGDTPECPAQTEVKQCPDYRNLMFPRFPTSDPLLLSAAQRTVVRANPVLYERVLPDACKTVGAVDLAGSGFAAGQLSAASALKGSCGGEAGGESVHLLRLSAPVAKLTLSVSAEGFTPVVYLRSPECVGGTELMCQVGETSGAVVATEAFDLAAGAYYIVVDSADGGGFYRLTVTLTPGNN